MKRKKDKNYDVYEIVAKNIKYYRKIKKMTQAELAELIGESRQDINKAVKGGTSPKDLMIRKKIYKVLGMT